MSDPFYGLCNFDRSAWRERARIAGMLDERDSLSAFEDFTLRQNSPNDASDAEMRPTRKAKPVKARTVERQP